MAGIKPQASWSPADEAAAIVPSDTAVMPGPPNGFKIYVGGVGDIQVDMALTGTAIVFKAVPVGTILPIMAKRVYATNTTATLLVAIW